MNDGDQTCRFLQLWITPDRRGHVPQYGSSQYDKADRHNRLLHILGGTGAIPTWPSVHSPNSIKLNQVSERGEGRRRSSAAAGGLLGSEKHASFAHPRT